MASPENAELAASGPGRAGRSLWADALRRFRRDRIAVLCFAVILVYVVIAIVSPLLFPGWSDEHDYDNINLAPSGRHWLGTDALGRSVFQKTLLGANTSLTVAFMANVIAVPLGMILGAIAGYYGGKLDGAIVWVFSTLASIPGIVLLMAMRYAFSSSIHPPPPGE